ncbi:NAD(P)H-dependent dehydrogenase/reductase [Labilibaculum filiforme]|uniref:NAD(P)H-dependent dehydrogenase/reductase n=1 Tax=Labilibaculum filiforme TaxID=1940526 RepID=A0A2N3I239_9BACT|nr:nitroreductase family protein [Labilibaculum filiforme]PKQ64386.1 NAD(P)H-dependent dehydrogenase/reductase [Labilibaculum filiforme]
MLELFYKRRSIRKFTDTPIEAEKLERILQAALLAPSSKSVYPCEFILVDKKEINEKLSTCKPHGASFLRNTAYSIIVAGDTNKSDVWIEDCAIAATFIQLQAEQEGLGTCWIQIRKREYNEEQSATSYIRKILKMPTNLQVLAIIAVGYKDGEKTGRDETHLKKEKIHRNQF